MSLFPESRWPVRVDRCEPSMICDLRALSRDYLPLREVESAVSVNVGANDRVLCIKDMALSEHRRVFPQLWAGVVGFRPCPPCDKAIKPAHIKTGQVPE